MFIYLPYALPDYILADNYKSIDTKYKEILIEYKLIF